MGGRNQTKTDGLSRTTTKSDFPAIYTFLQDIRYSNLHLFAKSDLEVLIRNPNAKAHIDVGFEAITGLRMHDKMNNRDRI